MTLGGNRISRRSFLSGATTVTAGAFALPALNGLGLLATNGRSFAAPGHGGYGPLAPVADLRDGIERIALPAGFQYRSFGIAGAPMSDGNLTPYAHDGMAVFNYESRFRLVRNHEDRNSADSANKSVGGNRDTKYDELGGGGTTTLIVNPFTRELEQDWVSLNGTIVNCAGGQTPWNSWVTCEETNAGTSSGWLKQHGFCFEVPASASGTVPAIAIPDMGRFAHEAVAVDPATGIVYETEDNGTSSGLYRYIPDTYGQLSAGGRLQMLGVDGEFQYNTYSGHPLGTQLPAVWYDIADPSPLGISSTAVFDQGRSQGAAAFGRLEGIWYGNGAMYVVSTSGGSAGEGQVWEYRPTGSDSGLLTLIFESPNAAVLSSPDNITFSPQGGLLLCEDGSGDQFLRGLTDSGEIFDFALNLQNGYEWAGACFAEADPSWNARSTRGNSSPLGERSERITLFVNRQGATNGLNPPAPGNEGMTFAIWGPWHEGAL